jgi:hypothetical protein
MGKKDYAGRVRTVPEVLLGDILGIKTYPFNIATANENQQSAIKAIKTKTTTEVNRTLRDQSKTPEQKARRIKLLINKRNQDTLKLLQGK